MERKLFLGMLPFIILLTNSSLHLQAFRTSDGEEVSAENAYIMPPPGACFPGASCRCYLAAWSCAVRVLQRDRHHAPFSPCNMITGMCHCCLATWNTVMRHSCLALQYDHREAETPAIAGNLHSRVNFTVSCKLATCVVILKSSFGFRNKAPHCTSKDHIDSIDFIGYSEPFYLLPCALVRAYTHSLRPTAP
eukprot:1161469-Pelagomonas_calceolata.AAC.6